VTEPGTWTVQDSRELYRVDEWGAGFFQINAEGRIEVTPRGPGGPAVDLKELVDGLTERGLGLPLLIRFPDIIASRVESLAAAFDRAIADEGYGGRYQSVYPVKVNQQRRVVEALLESSGGRAIGLEAGSKPEVLAALALSEDPESLLVLNGYKDAEYVETALLATKLGRNAILVVDRYRELDIILRVAERLGIRPRLGVRAQLDAQAEGKWHDSSGMGSKFGLETEEIVDLVEELRRRDLLDCLHLLHFHVGSQISGIRGLKDAVQEAARIYVELHALGASLKCLDVGGGLGVDYDGTQSSNDASMNYDLQEYANNVVYHVREMCDERGVPHPDLVSESGRALVAHHSVLVLDVLDCDREFDDVDPDPLGKSEHRVLQSLHETWRSVEPENLLECWHDANFAREEAIRLFASGVLDLRGRGRADALYRACCARIVSHLRDLEEPPEDLADLERKFCDIYFGNFSIFQSAPDSWAIDQLFPIAPIHRLDEEPSRRGILADLTCDSDGVIDRFIGAPDERTVLELHPLDDRPYQLGIFLIGAYQEILGDYHNLFGDTNAVHVVLDEDGRPLLADVQENDSVTDVLGYVGYDRRDLLARLRRAVERALRAGHLSRRESRLFLKDYEHGLSGTTYLEEDDGTLDEPAAPRMKKRAEPVAEPRPRSADTTPLA
jgi:arginine decarboxylase